MKSDFDWASALLFLGVLVLLVGLAIQCGKKRRSRRSQSWAGILFLIAVGLGITALAVLDPSARQGHITIGLVIFMGTACLAAAGAWMAAAAGLDRPVSGIQPRGRQWKRAGRKQAGWIFSVWLAGLAALGTACWTGGSAWTSAFRQLATGDQPHSAPIAEDLVEEPPHDSPESPLASASDLRDTEPAGSEQPSPIDSLAMEVNGSDHSAPNPMTESPPDSSVPGTTIEDPPMIAMPDAELAERPEDNPSEAPVSPSTPAPAAVSPVIAPNPHGAPDPARPIVISAKDKRLYAQYIRPILQRRCFDCHGAEKQKGELRLDSPEHFRKGGDSGPIVIAGDPENSLLYQLTSLPADDPDVMPPKGKPLTANDLAKIKAWIERGGYLGDGKDVPMLPQPVAAQGTSPSKDSPLFETLEQAYLLARPINGTESMIELNASHADQIDWQLIDPIAARIQVLILRKTRIGDTDLVHVSRMPGLVELQLSDTAIGDKGLSHLSGLKNLEVLNLYGTRVSDAGLRHLHGLKKLQKIYLWNSEVTPGGARKLQEQLPGASINIGASFVDESDD